MWLERQLHRRRRRRPFLTIGSVSPADGVLLDAGWTTSMFNKSAVHHRQQRGGRWREGRGWGWGLQRTHMYFWTPLCSSRLNRASSPGIPTQVVQLSGAHTHHYVRLPLYNQKKEDCLWLSHLNPTSKFGFERRKEDFSFQKYLRHDVSAELPLAADDLLYCGGHQTLHVHDY